MGMMNRVYEEASRNLYRLINERTPQANAAEGNLRDIAREVLREHSFLLSTTQRDLVTAQQTRTLWRKLRNTVTNEALPPLEALIHARAFAREQLERVHNTDPNDLFKVAINAARRDAIMAFLDDTQNYAFEEVQQEDERNNP